MKDTDNEKIIPNDALVIMVGIPGSGKSTLAKKIAKDENEIISTDEIRGEINGDESDQSNVVEVFEEYHRRIEERLKNGQLAIADATSIIDFSRQNLYDIAKKYNRPIRIIIMNIPLNQCLRQNKNRARKVPKEVIISMYNNLKKEYNKIAEEIKILPDAKVYDVMSLENEIAKEPKKNK